MTPTDSMKFDLKNDIQSDADRKKQLIEVCKQKGLTWEGIYDGVQEYDGVIPRPISTT